jgi:hypothetical protein
MPADAQLNHASRHQQEYRCRRAERLQ